MAFKNKKIKNATKVEKNGIIFDSKLESYMYHMLTINRIPFEFQKTYEIQEGFVYNGKKIQNIRIIVDFDLVLNYNLILDTKGFSTPENKLKHKMLKYVLKDFNSTGKAPEILLPANQKEVDAIILKLRDKKQ